MLSPDTYGKNYREVESITREHARTFYFCSMLLEKNKRLASYSVYGFLRLLDDCFDASGNNAEKLQEWRSRIDMVYSGKRPEDPVLSSLQGTVEKYCIPEEYFREVVRGMEMDVYGNSYTNFGELYTYCYRVAGVVGLIMLEIFGYSDKRAMVCAEKMGIAMQLTNILRDIKEDMALGRVYLPSDELERFGLSPETIPGDPLNGDFVDFMRFQIDRARDFYNEGFMGIKYLKAPNSRFIAALMGKLYSGILDEIERSGYDVFSKRRYVPLSKKILLSLQTLAFYRPGQIPDSRLPR